MTLVQTVHQIYSGEAVGCDIFDRFLNFDNCHPEAVSDVIAGTIDQEVGVNDCVNFGDCRLKPLEASF